MWWGGQAGVAYVPPQSWQIPIFDDEYDVYMGSKVDEDGAVLEILRITGQDELPMLFVALN